MTTSTHPIIKDLMTHVLQVLYMLFLGIVIAAFFGLGVDTFYPSPKTPEFPQVLQDQQYKATAENQMTNEERAAQKKYDADMTKYQKDLKPYDRNASIIIVVLAVIALVLSLTVVAHWAIISNGVLLGGVFTLAYGIILGMQTDDTKFRFLVISIAALVTLALGYVKFIRKMDNAVEK
jgi:hypothetical protein